MMVLRPITITITIAHDLLAAMGIFHCSITPLPLTGNLPGLKSVEPHYAG